MPALKEPAFVALDVETTGLSPRSCRVIEIAAVRFEGGRERAAVSALVDAGVEVPAAVSRLTGLQTHLLRGQRSFEEAWRGVQALSAGAAFFVAHNASFDRAFVVEELRRCGSASSLLPWRCSLQLLRRKEPRMPGRLSLAARRHGIALGQAHRALDDARAAGLLYAALADGNEHGDLVQEPLPLASPRRQPLATLRETLALALFGARSRG